MKKLLLLFCLFYLAFLPVSVAQNTDSLNHFTSYRNVFFAEVGGNSGIGLSGNYERLFPLNSKRNVTFALRAGYGVSGGIVSAGSFNVTPVEVSVFWGNRNVKPEVGFGVAFIDDTYKPDLKKVFISRIGIRIQKPGNHLFWKINVSGWIRNENTSLDALVFPMPGIVLGYSFGKK